MQEIERKFLVKDISKIDLTKYKRKSITQIYLYSDKITTIRKRKVQEDDKANYYYTVKVGRTSKYGTEEIENEITLENYEKLKPTQKVNIIEKDRYIIPLDNNLKVELDIFKGIFKGIIFAEIEFPSENMAETYKVPEWFDKELSNKISNNSMSKMTREEVNRIINK